MIRIGPATAPADVDAVKALFRAYVDDLTFALDFQDFDAEMADFPGSYGPPSGALLLARRDGAPVGAVGLRDLGDGVCEMKRLYVSPAARGLGLGARLVDAVLAEGRRLGYRAMRLDTVPSAQPRALALYHARGFREIAPYCFNPLPDATFMERGLIET